MTGLWRRARKVVHTRAHQLIELVSQLGFELAQIVSVAVIFPIVAPALGPEDYGRYTTLYVLAGFAMTWVSAAGGAAMVQLIVQHGRTSHSVMQYARRQIYWSALPFAVVGLIVSGLLFGTRIIVPAILVFGGDLAITGIALVHVNAVFAARGVASASRIKLWLPIQRTVGVVALALLGQITLMNVVAISSFSSVIILIIALRSSRGLERFDRDDSEPTTARELLRYTGTYAATISANAVQNEGETIVLASFRPTSEVGEYQAAYRLISLALVPLRAVTTVATRWALFPSDQDGAQLRRVTRLSAGVAVYGVLVVFAALLARPLIDPILGDEYKIVSTIFVWLCGFPLIRALADLPVLGLIGLDRNRERMALGIGGSIAALTLYLILVPTMGWRGGVIGTYLSESLTLTGGWILLVIHQRRADRARHAELDSEGDPGPDEPDPAHAISAQPAGTRAAPRLRDRR